MVNIRILTHLILQRLGLAVATTALVFLPLAAPITSYADTPSCTAPPDSSYGNGVHHPTGADASLFTYDCTSKLWLSSHYSYNPVNGQYKPLDPQVYTYNPTTGKYDYVTWVYSAPTKDYVKVNGSTATPPSGATVVGAPAPAPTSSNSTPGTNSIGNTGTGSNNTITDNGGTTDGSSISNTGANSNNNINGNSSSTTTANNNTGVSVTNQLNTNATTGNALVLGNTTASGATSGDATDTANVTNLLQSSSNALGGNAVTFVANIDGDVNGNLLLDPSAISNVQPATSSSGNNITNLTTTSNESITNNLNLSANSGDATVSENTSAGGATSGAAKTIANVVNLIDSAITSGRSFLGVININGNLNGDILMPSNFVDQLLAANVPTVNIITNTGADSNNAINSTGSNTTNVTNTNNQGVTNNVKTTASTGNASESYNTEAGSAASGTANTGITAFNLTGSQVIGQNDLLVFVNVAGGKWVGLIVNTPAGATAAEFGGGISTASAGNNTANITNNTNQTITNNIDMNSQSGNASVDRNTKAGNATSGNADAAANLLNVENSTLSLSNWFGILFINVFGTWNGNFGFETASNNTGASSGGLPGSFVASPAFSFQPKTVKAGTNSGNGNYYTNFSSAPSNQYTVAGTGGGSNSSSNSVLAAVKNVAQAPHSIVSTPTHLNWATLITGGTIIAIYLAGERYYAVRQRSRSNA